MFIQIKAKLPQIVLILSSIYLVACSSEVGFPTQTPTVAVTISGNKPMLIQTATPSISPVIPTSIPSLPAVTSNTSTPAATVAFFTPAHTQTPIAVVPNTRESIMFFAREDDLWRADMDGNNINKLTEDGMLNWRMNREGDEWLLTAQSRLLYVSPDNHWIAFAPTGSNLMLVDTTMQQQPKIVPSGSPNASWSSDSRYLAYGQHSLLVYDLYTHQIDELLTGYGRGIHNLVWSPDNRFIAFACCFSKVENDDSGIEVGEIQQVEVSTSQVEMVGTVTLSIGGGVPQLCWAHEGQAVTTEYVEQADFAHCSNGRSLNFASSFNGSGTKLAILAPALADDELWTGPSLLIVKDVATDKVLWQFVLERNLSRIVWSPDNQYLLLDDNQSRSPIWRITADGLSEFEVMVIDDGFLLGVSR